MTAKSSITCTLIFMMTKFVGKSNCLEESKIVKYELFVTVPLSVSASCHRTPFPSIPA